MELINDVEKPVEKPAENDLNNILSGYREPMTVQQPTQTTTPNTAQNLSSNNPTSWVGNPEYYQTGKKAGQKKPLNKAKLTYVPPPNMEVSGEILTGAMCLTMIDFIIPMLISMTHNFMAKTKINYEDLKLTDKQRNELTPVANNVVKALKLNANPVAIAIVSLLCIYSVQTMVAIQKAKLKEKIDKSKFDRNDNRMATHN